MYSEGEAKARGYRNDSMVVVVFGCGFGAFRG